MNLKFIPPSDRELEDAYYIYEDQLEKLGDEFLIEFNKTIKLLLDYPKL